MISSCDAPFYVNPIIGPQAEAEGMCNLVNPVLNHDLRAGARVPPSCHFYLEVNVKLQGSFTSGLDQDSLMIDENIVNRPMVRILPANLCA